MVRWRGKPTREIGLIVSGLSGVGGGERAGSSRTALHYPIITDHHSGLPQEHVVPDTLDLRVQMEETLLMMHYFGMDVYACCWLVGEYSSAGERNARMGVNCRDLV